jgi:hypothetical protein
MDAPKGRYRVIEKDGRLVVIDNRSGAPVSPSMPAPRASGGGGASPQPVIASGKGIVDAAADALLTLAVHEWDGEGRAVVRWRWTQNDKEKRWDAALDKAQQSRLGRGLLAFLAAPAFVLVMIVFGPGALALPGFVLAALPVIWGVWTINRLMAETGAQLDDPG